MFKTGDVILIHNNPFKWYKPKSYIPSLIRIFCKTRYNHCGVVVFNWGVPVLNEAISSGVHSTPIDIALSGKEIMVRRPRYFNGEASFAIRANSFLGKTPYDYWTLLLVQPIYIITGKWIGKKSPSADKKQVCSEYVANCYKVAEAYKVKPDELRDSSDFITIYKGRYNENT